jgi:predicted nucleic acid-binding protein
VCVTLAGVTVRFCRDSHGRHVNVLQNVAWQVAGQLGWNDTFNAEYIALTQLHADAFITLDRQLAQAAKDLVTIAPIGALSGSN